MSIYSVPFEIGGDVLLTGRAHERKSGARRFRPEVSLLYVAGVIVGLRRNIGRADVQRRPDLCGLNDKISKWSKVSLRGHTVI